MAQCARAGQPRKGLEIFLALPRLGIVADTAAANAAITACDKAGAWDTALQLFSAMADAGLAADAITFSALISALARGRQVRVES